MIEGRKGAHVETEEESLSCRFAQECILLSWWAFNGELGRAARLYEGSLTLQEQGLEQVEFSSVCRAVTWGGCADNMLHRSWSACTDTHCCTGGSCGTQPSVAQLPAFQVERQNSFIFSGWIAALPGFCTAVGTEGWSELSAPGFKC